MERSPVTTPLLTLMPTSDNMFAFIPPKSPLSPKLGVMEYEEFCVYIKSLGFSVLPTKEAFGYIHSAAKSSTPFFAKPFYILKGQEFLPPQPAKVKWINPHHLPPDLVKPGIPFAVLVQATPPIFASDIFGALLPATEEQKNMPTYPLATLDLPLTLTTKGQVVSQAGGQATFINNKLILSSTYVVHDLRREHCQTQVFPCHVLVKCNLENIKSWQVEGDLTVQGHWNTSMVSVKGNVVVTGKMQTHPQLNLSKDLPPPIRIYGNLQAASIQFSHLEVLGNVHVEKSIHASSIFLEGDLQCLGKIMGAEIHLKNGKIMAQMVGHHRDQPSLIKFYTSQNSAASQIQWISSGCRLQISKRHIIVEENQSWPPPKAGTYW